MNKSTLALAMLAAWAGLSHAQSSMTVYGSIDGGLRNQTNTTAAGGNKLTMGSNGTFFSNRLGFTGTEDLGDGLSAKYVLESGFNTGTGALDNTANTLFNRSAWVGLSGKWGSLSVGRQYTVAFVTARDYEPFTYRYISLTPVGGGSGTTLPGAATAAGLGASATAGTRFNNDIQYSGSFGPVTALAEYAAGEQAGSVRNGAAQAIGLKYRQGTLNLGGAYTIKKTATGFDNTSYTVGGGYKIGELQAKLGYAKERQDSLAAGSYSNKVSWAGLIYQFDPQLELVGAWYNSRYNHAASGKRNLFIIGAAYSLSKRTRLYADIDRNLYQGALVPATRQTGLTGISAGINHMF